MTVDKERLDTVHRSVPADYYHKGIEQNFIQKLWHKRRCSAIQKALKMLPLKQGDKILDMGCHGGYVTNVVATSTPCKVTGIDISENAIQFARDKYPDIDFMVWDAAHQLPYDDSTFKVVTAFDVIEHFIDQGEALDFMKKVLDDDGYIVIGTESENHILFNFLWYVWKKFRGRVWTGAHASPFDPGAFRKLTKEKNLTTVKEIKTHLGMVYTIVLKK